MSRAVIAGALMGVALVSGGMLIQGGVGRAADAAPSASARLLDEVMARIRNDFIDTVAVDELFRRAASGLVKEIEDPYSSLLSSERYRRLRESTSGRYAGVGIEIGMRDGFVTIIAPLAGTPADSAGVEPGDRLVAVDGTPTIGLSLEEVQQLLRGPSGTQVRLSLERGMADPVITLRRREIVFHPVQRVALLPNGVGYVELATFSEHAEAQVRRAVDSLRGQGARALILDLRENPGGLLEQGLQVADLFLDAGQTIASTRGRVAEANAEYDDQAAQAWPAMPIVALVDSGTASAAEIVAGALQDHGRAVVVGAPTYGKGSAQSVYPVLGGRALKLTTARWFTPNGRTIERDSTAGGITPDVEVRPAEGTPASRTARTRSSNWLADPVIARAQAMLAGITTPAALKARADAMARRS